MKKLDLTLKNVEKIKNETDNRLVSRVCRYIISNWEYHDNKKDIFLDVMHDRDACRDLIYYGQIKRFYETFKFEINGLLYKVGCDNLADLMGSEWDIHDPLALEEDNQNLLAWFGFKKTMTDIAYKFGIK